MPSIDDMLTPAQVLPQDHDQAVLIGRLWTPGLGPTLVRVTERHIYDLSGIAATSSQLLEMADPLGSVREFGGPPVADTAAVLANSAPQRRDPAAPWLLAPCDLQAIKAAGVTFVASMLERVIEEQARGDAARAESVRRSVVGVIGDNLRSVKPGSPQARQLRDERIRVGVQLLLGRVRDDPRVVGVADDAEADVLRLVGVAELLQDLEALRADREAAAVEEQVGRHRPDAAARVVLHGGGAV